MIIYYCFGGVAQLGERLNGIQEVNGSIPSVSTIIINKGYIIRCALCYFFYNGYIGIEFTCVWCNVQKHVKKIVY